MTRHEMRANAFLLTFEKIFNGENITELIDIAKQNDTIAINSDVIHLATEIQQHIQELDGIITNHLDKWSIDRISKVVLAILRLAVYEILYETPSAIVINEAVELAKEYSSQEDAAFVNGVLGSVARKQEAEQATHKQE